MTTVSIDATNVAVVQGQLSGPPRRRALPSGSVLVELDVTTRGDGGSSIGARGLVRSRFARRVAAARAMPWSSSATCADASSGPRRSPRAAPRSLPHRCCGRRGRRRSPGCSPRSPRCSAPRRDRRRDQRTEKPPRSVGGSATTSTPVTLAAGGPTRHQATALATSASGPSNTASTVPSGRLRTHPPRASSTGDAAARLAEPHALHLAADDHAVADSFTHRATDPSRGSNAGAATAEC